MKKVESWMGWAYLGDNGHLAFYDKCPCLYSSRKRAWESVGYPAAQEIVRAKVTVTWEQHE